AGNDVEGPGAIDIALFRIHGEGDAHFFDGHVRGVAAVENLVVTQGLEVGNQSAGRQSRIARRADDLIEKTPWLIGVPVDCHVSRSQSWGYTGDGVVHSVIESLATPRSQF